MNCIFNPNGVAHYDLMNTMWRYDPYFFSSWFGLAKKYEIRYLNFHGKKFASSFQRWLVPYYDVAWVPVARYLP